VVTLLLPHYDSDMGFGMSGEMIFLFFLVLILFGPKKMPEIARQVARMMNEFRRASNEFRSQIESEVNALDMSGKDMNGKAGTPRQQILPPLQAPLGSIANRIFNPPSAEKREAAETAVAETAVAEPSAAEQTAIADGASPVSAVEAATAPASKVAPDA
jgi:sec-independent protein translocase protein TatB